MKTTYILKLDNKKYLNRLLRYQVHFYKIKYQQDICFLYVNYDDYKKLIKYQDLYGISLYKITGLLYYQNLLKKKFIFISSVIVGIISLFMLSNIIFDIKIMSNNKEIIKIIKRELDEADFKKYRFIKSYEEKEILKKEILSNYQDKIEWLEIDRIGTKYYVKVLERVLHKEEDNRSYQNIVARKNAVILEIKATKGEIVKKVNDYVNKGEVIVSGLITKKDEVKNIVSAQGQIYGETWYNVKVTLPKTYRSGIYTGNSYNRLPISLNYTKIKEIKNDTYFYTYQDALDIGLSLAKEKLMNNLMPDSKIMYQKKLKLYEENSTIIIEVFFKVYEDITDYQKIMLKEGE